MTKLLNCPFCGGEAKLFCDNDGIDISMSDDDPFAESWSVSCWHCGSSALTDDLVKSAAIAAWNTRPSQWNHDMEAAPKDGTEFDAWMVCGCHDHRMPDARYVDGVLWFGDLCSYEGAVCGNGIPLRPTHWISKPLPPE